MNLVRTMNANDMMSKSLLIVTMNMLFGDQQHRWNHCQHFLDLA